MDIISAHPNSATQNVGEDSAVSRIRLAQSGLKSDRRQGLAALNEIFRAGTTPEQPLNGTYMGELVALDVAPGLTWLAERIASNWMPWKGKTFIAARASGDNIFGRDSLFLAHVFWPLYHDYVNDNPETYRAFTFRTYVAPGLSDPDRQVLKIDYDLKVNPLWTIRRVLDELVQVAEGLYMGKAHLKWWWGRWQLVGYFTLKEIQTRS
jgi:hypothetical protein